jgi:hypothetical protein
VARELIAATRDPGRTMVFPDDAEATWAHAGRITERIHMTSEPIKDPLTDSDALGANARQVMIDIFRKKDVTAVGRILARRSYSMTRILPTVSPE